MASFSDDMIVYVGDQKEIIKFCNYFVQVIGDEIHIRESLVFLYTSSNMWESQQNCNSIYNHSEVT